MFGRKKKQEQRRAQFQRLRIAVERVEESLAAPGADLEFLHSSLKRLYLDSPKFELGDDPEFDGIIVRAYRLIEELEKRTDEALREQTSRRLRPCPHCDGREFLVSADPARIDEIRVGPHDRRISFSFSILVCQGCGDIRFTASDVAELRNLKDYFQEDVFLPVTANTRPGGVYR